MLSPQGSPVHGIFQARILECIAISAGDLLAQGLHPYLLHLLHCRWILYLSTIEGFPFLETMKGKLQCLQMPVRRKGGMGKNWMWIELLVAQPVLQETILIELDLSDLLA